MKQIAYYSSRSKGCYVRITLWRFGRMISPELIKYMKLYAHDYSLMIILP